MKPGKPYKIAIDHDNYHAEHVGKTKSGHFFFLTTPFESARKDFEGCEYIALFLFDYDGNNTYSIIDRLGPRGSYTIEYKRKKYFDRLHELGEVEFCRIEVKPFFVEKYGIKFGLILRVPEDEGDVWAVELLPGNYMAFFEPWDSGVYDT